MQLSLPTKEEALSVILKLPGEVCNLNCHYCYEKRKPSGPFKVITPKILTSFFEKANGRPLSIEFHGGEPLIIGKSNMIKILKTCQQYQGDLRIGIQTNATLLDQEWLDLFKSEWPEIEFATSIDGDPVSTKHRVDYNDNETHGKIEAVFELFEKNKMELGVICTVTSAALGREKEILNYFLQFPSINLLKLNPCFDFNVVSKITPGNKKSFMLYNPNGRNIPGWGIRPLDFLNFLKNFFDVWVTSNTYEKILVEPYLSIIRVLGGQRANFCVYDEQKCASMLTLYPDGRLGSCDELDMPDSLLASHIDDFDNLEDIIHFQTNKELHYALNEILEKCTNCEYNKLCKGGCLATRKRYLNSDYYEEYCQYRIGIIDHVSKYLKGDNEYVG